MAPVTSKTAAAVDVAATTNSLGMSADEVAFLVDCLKYPAGGASISIDTKAVAEARGQKNAGSVANRILKMRKKYNLPIGAGGSPARKGSDSNGEPVSPTKNRVTKTRGIARVKKAVKKVPAFDSEEDMKVNDVDDDDVKEDGNTSEDDNFEDAEVLKVEDKIKGEAAT